jgi:micrococcal nuclease
MKKRILVAAAVLLFLPAAVFAAEFWASKNSNKYHYPSCRWAQKIKPDNLVKFSTPEQAAKAGYQSCKVCGPPAPGR